MNYYERHLGDYAKDTAHLSMLEHGAYTLLLDRYYATEKGIPDDQVFRVARAKSKPEKAAVEVVLREFFFLDGDVWKKNRCENEIAFAQNRIETARENGKRGGRPKTQENQSKDKPSGLSLGSETETHEKPGRVILGSENETQTKALQTPDSRLQSPKKKDRAIALAEARAVHGVNLVAFDRWIGYRDQRKPIVKTISLVACAEQLAKFGNDDQQAQAVQNSIANGYQGLVAQKANGNGSYSQPAKPVKYRTADEIEAEERARGDWNA